MPGQNLTRDEAQRRASVVSRVEDYIVELDLTTGPETFATTTTITFTATPGEQTFVDFIGRSVERIELNGKQLDPAQHFSDSRVTLSGLAERNTVTIAGTGVYMHTGEGLHRFEDPADGEVYLYTQFEVADCRRMFAVFEQPDLKASFAVTVTAPAHWEIISNEPTPAPEEAAEGTATWRFAPSARISSYLTALIAGPYARAEDTVTTGGRQMPLRLFCRKSLFPHLDAEAIFDVTKKGFAYYEREFACDYPFTKYDQIFTPEYNAGAMENVGAVTFVEDYLFRSKVPASEYEQRAETILHELAHMWFGNLVTMKWWDDLWLNESFATWASNAALVEATEWTEAWTTFALTAKAWGYNQDQLSSTHPVGADMVDLEAVEANFDGITYAKGASVLKQLTAYVGRDAFREALRAYFAKHAWGNTEFADLLHELAVASGRDMDRWAQLWLRTSSVNTLRPVVETGPDGAYTSVIIEQTALPGYETLRPHRIGIGLYALDGDRLVRTRQLEVDIDGELTQIPELTGVPQADLLLLNDEDLAYTKIRLDQRSQATALGHAHAIEDSLARTLVMGACWDMVRDGELAASDYLALVLRRLPLEKDPAQLEMLNQQISACSSTYCAPARRSANRDRAAEAYRGLLSGAEPGSDAQLLAVKGLATHGRTEEHVSVLSGLLNGDHQPEGLTVDQDLRWVLLRGLAAAGAAEAADIEDERARDRSAAGNELALGCLAARPTAEAKADAWHRTHEGGLPSSQVREAGRGFQAVTDPSVLLPYIEKYFDSIEDVWETQTFAIANSLARLFYPAALAEQTLLDSTQAWLDQHEDASPGLRRIVQENRDTLARALRAQERDAR